MVLVRGIHSGFVLGHERLHLPASERLSAWSRARVLCRPPRPCVACLALPPPVRAWLVLPCRSPPRAGVRASLASRPLRAFAFARQACFSVLRPCGCFRPCSAPCCSSFEKQTERTALAWTWAWSPSASAPPCPCGCGPTVTRPPAKLVLVVLVVLVCYSCSYWQCSLAVLRESACDTVLQSQGWCRGR